MDRRTFTLQLFDGLQPRPQPPGAPALPSWRCSGCLMAWGVYGPTMADARPQGDGCPLCVAKAWMADNQLALAIDERAGIRSKVIVTPRAKYAIAVVEAVIVQGHYNRLTHSIQPLLTDKVRNSMTRGSIT